MTDRQIFETGIEKFVSWLDHNGTAGYDPYDLWSTGYGRRARRLYYRYGKLAAPIVAPLLAADILAPSMTRTAIAKKRYATSHAHLILGFVGLCAGKFDRHGDWLARAKNLAEELDEIKVPNYSGDCWGYPFDWENRRGLWPKNTPLITVTPYCFEALVALSEATEDSTYRERARSVLKFALNDLNNIERPAGAVASSYSPLDQSLVVNASAYRAFVLTQGGQIFGDAQATDLGGKLVKFVLDSQRPDGSWPYALEQEGDDFIDHFHTCFVLKNLVKINNLYPAVELSAAIEKGFAYYRRALFDKHELPKPFADGRGLLRYDLYSFAEAINLGVLLRDQISGALEMALTVARETVTRFQLADGHFVSSVNRIGIRNTVPFIRWPQAQMFHALASLWLALD